jgi:hypothetical protein
VAQLIVSILVLISLGLIAVLIYARATPTYSNRLYILLCSLCAFWIFTLVLEQLAGNPETLLPIVRLDYVTGLSLSTLFMAFIVHFPQDDPPNTPDKVILGYAWAQLLTLVGIGTPIFVQSVRFTHDSSIYQPELGPLFWLYAAIICANILIGFMRALQKFIAGSMKGL